MLDKHFIQLNSNELKLAYIVMSNGDTMGSTEAGPMSLDQSGACVIMGIWVFFMFSHVCMSFP